MLPDWEIRAFTARIQNYFGETDERLTSVALELLDAGYGESEIRDMLGKVYAVGYDEGYKQAIDEERG